MKYFQSISEDRYTDICKFLPRSFKRLSLLGRIRRNQCNESETRSINLLRIVVPTLERTLNTGTGVTFWIKALNVNSSTYSNFTLLVIL